MKLLSVEIDRDLETIFLCAIRYAMGRRTYMPSLVCDYITRLLPMVSNQFLRLIMQEYNTYQGDYGDQCDYQTWMKFKEDVKKELEVRGIRVQTL